MKFSRSNLAVNYPHTAPVRRRVVIATDDGYATAGLEDDFHRMDVALRHDGVKVTAISGESSRHPWQLCARATEKLDELVGAQIGAEFVTASEMANQRVHCTHLYDLATHAIVAAARGTVRRIYDSVCTVDGEIACLKLWRDDELVLDWQLDRSTVISKDAMNGQNIRHGFATWCRDNVDPETAEAALALRRVAMIAHGRGVDLDLLPDATPVVQALDGACYVLREGNGPNAPRLYGSTISFDGPPPLTPHKEVREWLSTLKR